MNKYYLLLWLVFSLQKIHSQGFYENLEVKIKKDVNWWAGILIEGHKMPLKQGYEAQLYGTSYFNQLQPLLLSTDGELVWSEEPFRFKVNTEKI